jgi:hypothetical protein
MILVSILQDNSRLPRPTTRLIGQDGAGARQFITVRLNLRGPACGITGTAAHTESVPA